ncbi:MAG: biotin/lipoyl-binding protein, partial [Variovorax sp.]
MTRHSTGRALTMVLVIIVIAVLLGAGYFWWSQQPHEKDTPRAAAPARPALTVSVARPEQRELTITLAANGNIAAWQEASIGSESTGLRLADVRVNVGDVVKKGQVLATFSSESVQADVAQARAGLAEARAAAADAAGSAA